MEEPMITSDEITTELEATRSSYPPSSSSPGTGGSVSEAAIVDAYLDALSADGGPSTPIAATAAENIVGATPGGDAANKKKKSSEKNSAFYDVFKTMRDASVYASKGIISIGEFQFVRRAVFINGKRINNPFMSHLFRAMVEKIIIYATANSTLPSGRLLKQWQSDAMFGLLPDGRIPPAKKDWMKELQDEDGIPPSAKDRLEAENDASYKVKVAIRPLRSKSITPQHVPPFIQLPRISYTNFAFSLDVSSLHHGLHDFVGRLITHIGDMYAHNKPFSPTHPAYKIMWKIFESESGMTVFQPFKEDIQNVILPRLHRQRALEKVGFGDDDELLEDMTSDEASKQIFDAAKKLDMTPYDRFFYKYFYCKDHKTRLMEINKQIDEQASISLEQALEEENARKERELREWKARGVEMVKQAMLEQREREYRLSKSRSGTKQSGSNKDDDIYAAPPQSPMPTTEQLEAVAEIAVANATWQQRMQEQQEQQEQQRLQQKKRQRALAAIDDESSSSSSSSKRRQPSRPTPSPIPQQQQQQQQPLEKRQRSGKKDRA